MMVVPKGPATWEIRESHLTPTGPRSRTLATFRSLTPEVEQRARERSSKTISAQELRVLARRAGAPLQTPAADRAAAELVNELARGREPRRVLRRLLVDSLEGERHQLTANAQAASAWLGATSKQRGDALRDLLSLGDRLPSAPGRRARSQFPKIESAPA
jgi:hypothetical protein